MISYELALELKNAGFPFESGGGKMVAKYPAEDIRVKVTPSEWADSLVYSPTLSELIEACGEEFGQLISYGDYWTAETHDEVGNYAEGEGKTPEIAASKLWLALNKKPT